MRATLRLARLKPGRRYDVRGAHETELVGDTAGAAWLMIDLADRLEVQVTPVA